MTAAFDVELGDDAVFDERDARLFDVNADDEDVLGHFGMKLSRSKMPGQTSEQTIAHFAAGRPKAGHVSAAGWDVCG